MDLPGWLGAHPILGKFQTQDTVPKFSSWWGKARPNRGMHARCILGKLRCFCFWHLKLLSAELETHQSFVNTGWNVEWTAKRGKQGETDTVTAWVQKKRTPWSWRLLWGFGIVDKERTPRKLFRDPHGSRCPGSLASCPAEQPAWSQNTSTEWGDTQWCLCFYTSEVSRGRPCSGRCTLTS